jgi:hypothetical protein
MCKAHGGVVRAREPLGWRRRELRTPTRWAAGEKRRGRWFDIRPEAAKHGVVRWWSSSSSACFWSPRIARRRAWTALVAVASGWSSPSARPPRRGEGHSCIGPGALTTSGSNRQEPSATDGAVLRYWNAVPRSQPPFVYPLGLLLSSVGAMPCST